MFAYMFGNYGGLDAIFLFLDVFLSWRSTESLYCMIERRVLFLRCAMPGGKDGNRNIECSWVQKVWWRGLRARHCSYSSFSTLTSWLYSSKSRF